MPFNLVLHVDQRGGTNLIKVGINQVTNLDPIALVADLPLLAGYALYGVFCLVMIWALRRGDLSRIYPILSLAYVWVAVLSYFIFHEPIQPLKLAGISTVMLGVALLGRKG